MVGKKKNVFKNYWFNIIYTILWRIYKHIRTQNTHILHFSGVFASLFFKMSLERKQFYRNICPLVSKIIITLRYFLKDFLKKENTWQYFLTKSSLEKAIRGYKLSAAIE